VVGSDRFGGVSQKKIDFLVCKRREIYFMNTIWQAYADFNLIAAATAAGLERLPQSQFASFFEVVQK